MFRARHLAQLCGHAERCGTRLLRLVGRQSLLFRLAFGANRCLKRQTRAVLSGNMLDRSVPRTTGFRGRSLPTLEREDHLPNLDLLALFYLHFFHYAADRRRNFDHGLIGLQLHDRLAFGNFGAGRDHQSHQVALRNIFAKFGEFELAGPRNA